MFPARAGMSPARYLRGVGFPGVPRASGDEPVRGLVFAVNGECSPRERG